MAGFYALLQKLSEEKLGKGLWKPVDHRVGDVALEQGQPARRLPLVLDPDHDGRINAGPMS